MTKLDALAILAFLGLTGLAACRHPSDTRDYQGVRDRAGAAQQSLDQESAKPR